MKKIYITPSILVEEFECETAFLTQSVMEIKGRATITKENYDTFIKYNNDDEYGEDQL